MARRLLLGLCLALLAGRAGGDPDAPPGLDWLTDLEKAEKESRKTGRPIFVVFRCEH
jgi:hypothetical protein